MGTTTPDLNPLDYSVYDILQELVYEGRREPYANLHELEKAIRQKWNEIDDQTIKTGNLQWKRRQAQQSQNRMGRWGLI